MKKIFITGGTGFFGKSILRYCQKNKLYEKYSINIFTRNISKFKLNCPESINLESVNFFEGDILDPSTFPNNDFDFVIHAATDSTSGLSLKYIERSNQIVVGTRNILNWSGNKQIKRFLFISSGGVYGKIGSPVKENHQSSIFTTNKDDTYSVSKFFAEHLCLLYSIKYNFSYSIARCFTFSGIDLPLKSHFAIGNFIHNTLNNKKIIINGDGSQIRSYMDQRDLSAWIFKILFDGSNNEIYNVGSDAPISILNLAKLIVDISEKNIDIIVKNKLISGQAKDRNFYVPDTTKSKKELGLKINFSLKDSISQFFL